MGRKESKLQKPLLYIVQPHFDEPDIKMQSQYVSSPELTAETNVSEGKDTGLGPERTKTRKRNVNDIEDDKFIFNVKEVEEEKIQAEEFPKSHTHEMKAAKGGLRPVKSFTSMTIEEKLYHLASNTQFYSCTFLTKGRRVIGKLHSNLDGHIVVRTDSGEMVSIDKQDLSGIRINI